MADKDNANSPLEKSGTIPPSLPVVRSLSSPGNGKTCGRLYGR